MRDKLRDLLRALVPTKARNHVRTRLLPQNHPALLHALGNLPVTESGVKYLDLQPVPFIRLADGIVLFGRWPNSYERTVYHVWKSKLPAALQEDAIRVAIDAIERYQYPHAMPHITMPYARKQRRQFHRQHAETISDLSHLSSQTIAFLQELFRPKMGEYYLDVGAYIGFGTVRVARELGPTGKIIAVEADPDAQRLLEYNVTANALKNIHIIPNAIWNVSGKTVTFYRSARQANALNSDMVPASRPIPVETITIDDILARLNIPCVDFISLTVNGAELEAVEGMKHTLTHCANLRLSIAGWYRRDGERIADIVAPNLKAAGFQVAIGKMGAVFAWKMATQQPIDTRIPHQAL